MELQTDVHLVPLITQTLMEAKMDRSALVPLTILLLNVCSAYYKQECQLISFF